jgi:signal transduction histidine kinase
LTFRDVSARTSAAAEAARRADFEEKLIGIVSHDLRNPLNVISLGTHSLLAVGQLDAPLQRTVRRIAASAQSATKLVNDLLDFTQARLGSGIPVRCVFIDLQGVVQQVLDQTQAAYPQRMIVLQVAGDAHGEWDADRVGQALMNLVSNALKYGDSSGPVTVRILGSGEGVTLEVHNLGTPIAPQLLPVLFEPMRRGSVPISDVGRSVGLGLYIVKQIAEAHSGDITVQSTASEGTTFAMFLPRRREPAATP